MPGPQNIPSNLPLKPAPHELLIFLVQTLTKDPQIDWQALKNFDYPNILVYIQYILTLSICVFLKNRQQIFFLHIILRNNYIPSPELTHTIINDAINTRQINIILNLVYPMYDTTTLYCQQAYVIF